MKNGRWKMGYACLPVRRGKWEKAVCL